MNNKKEKAQQSVVMRFLSNTGWQLAQNVYSMLLSLIVGALSARYLGPSNYGLISYGTSLVNLFVSVCRLGMDGVVINEMVKKKEKTGDYLGAVLVMRTVTSIISIVCMAVIIRVIEPENSVLHVVTLLQAIALAFRIYEVFNYWFQAELKSKYYVIASVVGLTVTSIWRISLLHFGASVEWFAASSSIQAGVVLIITVCVFRKISSVKLGCKLEDMRYLLGMSHHFILSTLAITLYMQTDKIMLGKMANEEMVGYYTPAMTIAALWEFVPEAITNSARPLIMEKRKNDYDGYIKQLQMLFLGVTLMALVVGIGITVLGRLAIMILYGEDYLPAVPVLMILIWSTGFAQIGTARSVWIVAENKNAYQKYMVILGALLNIVLNLVGITLWGMIGAAVATIISQVFVQFVAPLFFKPVRPFLELYFGSFRLLKEFKIKDFIRMIKKQPG